ncbi:proline racemase family protein [Thalassospira sp.]|uniref:proline racemase family protein n=1 Tax=Thalassospira sp. TaxID=1912094 RepID=UPI0027359117|nr:proline racemase family protein [Thalassospira sp.]MDP2696928.1 proline racemase family protein [Thalassospira sp.]
MSERSPAHVDFPDRLQPIEIIDMHTGGEPLRIIRHGYPVITGDNILAKRRYVRDHLDHLRRFLMFEPRGHADMYGALLVEPTLPDADLAVLFLHNEGYSTMCGHAIIALGRYAVDYELVPVIEPVTQVAIECPCGLVRAEVEVINGISGKVTFLSVPSFVTGCDYTLTLPDGTPFKTDIAYGGAFYAMLDAGQFGMEIGTTAVRKLVGLASTVCAAINASIPIRHPDHDDLGFLYGAILTDGRDEFSTEPTRNICIFADQQVDRSPTGSGVSARLALQHAKGQIKAGQTRDFESVTGAIFKGSIGDVTRCGPFPAIIARVGGMAHYCGESRLWLDQGDLVGQGFQIR